MIVFLKSIVGFVSNFKKNQFKRCSSQNFNIIKFVARELHLPKVEGIEIACFSLKSNQNRF